MVSGSSARYDRRALVRIYGHVSRPLARRVDLEAQAERRSRSQMIGILVEEALMARERPQAARAKIGGSE